MGRSNSILFPIYRSKIRNTGDIALLGFTNNPFVKNYTKLHLYDLKNGWDINSNWELSQRYDLIICTRCAYFCKNIELFFNKCYKYLNKNGQLIVDFGLGHHWSKFADYKVGWVKDGEHEWEYKEGNYLWSCIWDKKFEKDKAFEKFCERVEKFGYKNKEEVIDAICKEVPIVYELEKLEKLFNVKWEIVNLWEDNPQLYIILDCNKLAN